MRGRLADFAQNDTTLYLTHMLSVKSSMAFNIEKVKSRLTKAALKLNGGLAMLGSNSLVEWATEVQVTLDPIKTHKDVIQGHKAHFPQFITDIYHH